MIGRRVPPETRPCDLEPGDYMVRGGAAWVRLPSGVGPCHLRTWEFIDHDDGTITLSPSIHDVGNADGWHGWLERGTWESC